MAKSKISEKVITDHKFAIEGVLDVSNLSENAIAIDVEEYGKVDIKEYLDKFEDKNVRFSISDKVEDVIL